MYIWVLFSIANDYDQPDANLVAWWKDKPDYETILDILGLVAYKDKKYTEIEDILNGKEVKVQHGHDTDYRLEQIGEGEYERR